MKVRVAEVFVELHEALDLRGGLKFSGGLSPLPCLPWRHEFAHLLLQKNWVILPLSGDRNL